MNKQSLIKINNNIIYIILKVLFFSIVVIANTRSLFFSPTGSDDVTYEENSISNPWNTVEKLFHDVQTGDTCYFLSGTYEISQQINNQYYGIPGPIHIQPYENEKVIWKSNLGGVIIRLERSDYHFLGIEFHGGGTWIRFGDSLPSYNSSIRDCLVNMETGGDNVGFVMFHRLSVNTTIQNCIINGPGLVGDGIHGNTAGIILFRTPKVKVLNNRISNAPIGIYFKHSNTFDGSPSEDEMNIEIAYNFITKTDRECIASNTNFARIHNNVCAFNNAGSKLNMGNGVPGGDFNEVYHNSFCSSFQFDGVNEGPIFGAFENNFYDNLVVSQMMIHAYRDTPHNTVLDYNLYVDDDQAFSFRENSIGYSFNEWKSYYGQDVHSIYGNPTFVENTTVGLISVKDYELAQGSLGKNAASDGKDIGADISLVGPRGKYFGEWDPEETGGNDIDSFEWIIIVVVIIIVILLSVLFVCLVGFVIFWIVKARRKKREEKPFELEEQS